MVKNLLSMQETQETWVQFLGWEGPLEEGMATHSSILPWRIPWTEKSGGQLSTGPQRVRLDWRYLAWTHTTFEEPGAKKQRVLRKVGYCACPLHTIPPKELFVLPTPCCSGDPNKALPEFLVWPLINFYWLRKPRTLEGNECRGHILLCTCHRDLHSCVQHKQVA